MCLAVLRLNVCRPVPSGTVNILADPAPQHAPFHTPGTPHVMHADTGRTQSWSMIGKRQYDAVPTAKKPAKEGQEDVDSNGD